MSKELKAILQLALGLAIAAGLLYLTFQDSTWEEVSRLREVKPFWVAMAVVSLLLVFLFRALRWNMMLESAGHPAKLYHIILATLITYLANSLTPKLGEILRCSVLRKTDKVPVATSLGTVVSERVIDILVLFGGAGLLVAMELDRLGELVSEMRANIAGKLSGAMASGAMMWIAIAAAAVIVTALVGLYVSRKSPSRAGFVGKARELIATMLGATMSVFRLERPLLFLLYTALLWGGLIAMNYFFLLALPETSELGWYMAVLILFIGGIGWAAPVPGGMGTTHAIVWQLFVVFELSEAAGKNVAILSNGATLACNVLFGLIAWLLYLRISYRLDGRS